MEEIAFLNWNTLYDLVTLVLTTIGLWHIFKKCGINPKWALVPFYRSYKLSQCAEREDQGKWYLISKALFVTSTYVYKAVRIIQHKSETLNDVYYYVYFSIYIALGIMVIVYAARVYSGLCDVFKKKKWWILLWFGFEAVPALYWGLGKNNVPHYESGDDDGKYIDEISNIKLRSAEGVLNIRIRERNEKSLFKKKTFLKDINLIVEPGNMVLLLGGSGAGKTTFVNAVTGYEKADATVTLGGRDIYREFSSMMYDIGFVPQVDLIRYNDTVRKTIDDAAKLKLPVSVTKKEREEKVEETMEIFGLKSVQNSLVGKLSGGQKKRTSIATEFVADPTLFILDEPDSGLDGVLARDLMERLKAISRKGKIVIVITHSPDRVLDLFDKVIILAKDEDRTGRLVYYGEVDKALAFFGCSNMEEVIKMINRKEEGGEGKADELIARFEEERKNENK